MPRIASILWRLALTSLCALVVMACGRDPSPPTPTPAAQAQPTATDTPAPPAQPQASPTPFSAGDTVITASGLQYTEVVAGGGPQPRPGQVVVVHYTGTLQDGTVFDTSEGRDPIRFVLGAGQVLAGWDEGIALMNQGGQAILVIPPDLAYGEAGRGDMIPPHATLIFDVELVEIVDAAPDAPTPIDASAYITTPQGLQYADIVVGDGPTPMPGQEVVIHYTGWLADGGKFDSSLDRGRPDEFNVGMGQRIAGWDLGLKGMAVGGKRQLVVPPHLGFGEAGWGDIVPPNATLIYDIELIEVR